MAILLDLFEAMQTKRIHVSQLGIVLPAASPLRVAEGIAMLDHMSGGARTRALPADISSGGSMPWRSIFTSAPRARTRRRWMRSIVRRSKKRSRSSSSRGTHETFRYEGKSACPPFATGRGSAASPCCFPATSSSAGDSSRNTEKKPRVMAVRSAGGIDRARRILRHDGGRRGGAAPGQQLPLWINQGLSPVDDVLRGLELFAARVVPRFG